MVPSHVKYSIQILWKLSYKFVGKRRTFVTVYTFLSLYAKRAYNVSFFRKNAHLRFSAKYLVTMLRYVS